jgi:hypothetical protein
VQACSFSISPGPKAASWLPGQLSKRLGERFSRPYFNREPAFSTRKICRTMPDKWIFTEDNEVNEDFLPGEETSVPSFPFVEMAAS